MAGYFIGKVDERGKLDVDVRGEVADYIRTFSGMTIEVRVKKATTRRSQSQNRRYFALMTIGAESLWGDRSLKDALHDELAHLYFGLPPCPKTGLRRRRRTPDAETDEFSRYMAWCVHKLVDLGADLSAWEEEFEKVEAA